MTVMEQINGMDNVSDLFALTQEAMLISVSFGVMGNTKHVNTETQSTDAAQPNLFNSVQVKTDASLDVLSVSKTLLESDELKDIIAADGAIRNWLLKKALPFPMVGLQLIPYGMLPQVEDKLKEYKAKRQELVEKFMGAYYQLCINAKVRLGTLYNPLDYPTTEALRSRFTFRWRYVTLKVPDSLKLLSEEAYKSECAKAQEQLDGAVADAVLVFRESFHGMVAKLANSLAPSEDGKAKRLHTTAVTNLQEFLDDFNLRNITNDKQLAALVDKLKGMVSGVSAESLKANKAFKAKMQSKLESIASQASDLVEAIPARKYRKD